MIFKVFLAMYLDTLYEGNSVPGNTCRVFKKEKERTILPIWMTLWQFSLHGDQLRKAWFHFPFIKLE